MLNKTVVAACLAALCSLTALPSLARTVWVREAPPELRVESVPEQRLGYQWVPGHWEWHDHQYVWYEGSWVRARRGYVYVQPTWVERDGRWYLRSGQWRRHDRDRDGIPNRVDRDRDGDGVPNRFDSRPDNPKRQ